MFKTMENIEDIAGFVNVANIISDMEKEGLVKNIAGEGEEPYYEITEKGRIEANRNFFDVN